MALIRYLQVTAANSDLKMIRTGDVCQLQEFNSGVTWVNYFAVGDTLLISGTTTTAYSSPIPYLITDITGTIMTVTKGNTANWPSGTSAFQNATLKGGLRYFNKEFDSSGISGEFGSGTIETELDGGQSRKRKQFIGSVRRVHATYECNYQEYQDFCKFYNNSLTDDIQGTDEGSLRFYCNFSDRNGVYSEMLLASFVGGRVNLDSTEGNWYSVSFELEIY